MRILVINNYSMKQFLSLSDAGICPAHHCWGIDELRNNSDIKLRFALFKIPSICKKLHIRRFYYYFLQIIFAFKSIGCDCIYAAASPLIDFIGYMKYAGLINKKLIIVVHHPRNFSLKHQRYNKIIFICKEAYEQALSDYSNFKDSFIYQEWGPDLNFYGNKRTDNKKISFVSNGITNRDNFSLVEAVKNTSFRTGILCNQQSIPSNYDKTYKNIQLIYNKGTMMTGQIMSYNDMVSFISKYSICIIPTGPEQTGLCGLTSFCDAIALGMPVILSNTTHIYVDAEIEKFVSYYRAGDVKDLKRVISEFSQIENLEELSKASRKYAENHDYKKFAQTVKSVIIEEQPQPCT